MEKAEIKKTARRIAKTLNETNYHAIRQIQRLIEHVGLDFVEEHVAETQRIEAEGGMMTHDGKLRRTAGGVLFHIIKPKLTPEICDLIFPPPDWKKRRAKTKSKQQDSEKKASPSKLKDGVKTTKTIAKLNERLSAENIEQDELKKLQTAAETLRQRIAEMEVKGQKGVKMTRTLLKKTEKQIAALEAK